MIWPPEAATPDPAEALEPAVREALDDVLTIQPGLSRAPVGDIARSVAAWLNVHRPALTAAGREEIALLAARALHAVGHPLCARRMALVGSGFVHPSAWWVASGGTVWALDLAPLVRRPGDRGELMFYRALREAVDQLATLWPADGAAVLLGLRNLRTALHALLGRRAPRRARETLARDIRRFAARAAASTGARAVTCLVLDPRL